MLTRAGYARSIIGYQKAERFAISGETQPADTTIKILRAFHLSRRGTPVRSHDCQMLHAVGAIFSFVAFKECDPLSVRTPFRARTSATTARRSNSFFGCSRLCFGHKNLRGWITIRVFGVIAGKSNASAVGRPGGRSLIPFSGGQAIQLFRRNVEQVEAAVAA